MAKKTIDAQKLAVVPIFNDNIVEKTGSWTLFFQDFAMIFWFWASPTKTIGTLRYLVFRQMQRMSRKKNTRRHLFKLLMEKDLHVMKFFYYICFTCLMCESSYSRKQTNPYQAYFVAKLCFWTLTRNFIHKTDELRKLSAGDQSVSLFIEIAL